jgi:hypothetical protein
MNGPGFAPYEINELSACHRLNNDLWDLISLGGSEAKSPSSTHDCMAANALVFKMFP